MLYAFIYALVVLISLLIDACSCYCLKIRFKPAFSIWVWLLWPVTIPITLCYIAYKTKDFPLTNRER